MNILISNNSKLPLYVQIENQIKQKILEGSLKSGDRLPSMRVLAKNLKISLITTKKAYENLEKEGYLKTIVGKGTFVIQKELHEFNHLKQSKIVELKAEIHRIVSEAKNLGITDEELIAWIKEYFTEEDSH
ncbi:GntR family transcriptional regulator [Bacillus pakistanensis]|uniref:GntR family transcriptional regulator n=1 Tax=Rossellomorea pakistanensis TaxID=992288 RepID=A0ABS2NIL0_9BACI|nr:GntR family transcriptional regulator [Bacillus pakistanensis]MBM7587698.1 GntR family transcriptional regulator [Bacillus pakistanensis]